MEQVEVGILKEQLIGSDLWVEENVLTFEEGDPAKPYPILGEFKFFLDVIRDELKEYKIWPVCISLSNLRVCPFPSSVPLGQLLVFLLGLARVSP